MTASLREQLLPDGVHGELTPIYHALLTGYGLDFLDLFGAAGVAADLREDTVRMVDFLAAIMRPDRRMFVVGDTPDGYALPPVLARAARLLDRADLAALAADGQQGQASGKRNAAFTDGGFYTFRSGWEPEAVWLGVHCGPEPIEPFHSQFDRGTFELMAFGRLLMCDPGVFNYKSGDRGREAFRRTAAHQCLTLNGANAARAGRCRQWLDDDGQGNAGLTVENASYPGLTHRRTVFFVQRRWFVLVDEALGDATGEIDLHFQLTPGPAVIDPAAKTARTDFPAGGNVLVWAAPEAPVTLAAEEAWYSPKWWQKEPLPALRYRHHAGQAPARFVTVIVPYEGTRVPAVKAGQVHGPIGAAALALTVTVDGTTVDLTRSLP